MTLKASNKKKPAKAEVVQLPIRLTHETCDRLFGSKEDTDGLPRFRYSWDTKNRASPWSILVPHIHEWIDSGGVVEYYALETRFSFSIPS